MGGIGGPELLLVLLVVLVIFGPRKIPEIARGLGRGVREFRRLSTEFQRELNIADALEGKDAWGPSRPQPQGDRPPPPGGRAEPERTDHPDDASAGTPPDRRPDGGQAPE